MSGLPACLPSQLDYISTSSSTEDNIMTRLLPAWPKYSRRSAHHQTNHQKYHIVIVWGISRDILVEIFTAKKEKIWHAKKKVVKYNMLKKIEKCTAGRKKLVRCRLGALGGQSRLQCTHSHLQARGLFRFSNIISKLLLWCFAHISDLKAIF